MRNLLKVTLVLGLVALVASPALAQRPGGGGFGGGGLTQLLANKSVIEEMKLDEDTVKKVADSLKKVADDHKDELAKMRDRNTSMEERAEIRKKLSEADMAALKDVLKPEQITRVKQIQVFVGGLAAFTQADNMKVLKLTDDQVKDIKAITDDVNKQRPMAGGGQRPTPEAMEKFQAAQKEGKEKVVKMLTDDQKKAYEELAGKAFDYKPDMRRPPNQ